jgi:hypothetical protein
MARTAVAASASAGSDMSSEYAKACLSPLHRAHAHAAVDVERSRLDDALLEAPALERRVLEIEVGEIDVVRMDRPRTRDTFSKSRSAGASSSCCAVASRLAGLRQGRFRSRDSFGDQRFARGAVAPFEDYGGPHRELQAEASGIGARQRKESPGHHGVAARGLPP